MCLSRKQGAWKQVGYYAASCATVFSKKIYVKAQRNENFILRPHFLIYLQAAFITSTILNKEYLSKNIGINCFIQQ